MNTFQYVSLPDQHGFVIGSSPPLGRRKLSIYIMVNCLLGLYRSKITMLEELLKKGLDSQRARHAVINVQVVKLLQQKTIPLNKMRYYHLQKISKALSKERPSAYASTMQLSLPEQPRVQHQKLPSFAKSRGESPMVAAQLLMSRLKNIDHVKSSSQLVLKHQQSASSWEDLKSSLLSSGKISKSISPQYSQKYLSVSRDGQQKKQNLLQLAQRAEKYLRQKKHDLKQKYSRQQEYNKQNRRTSTIKQTQIQKLLSAFKAKQRRKVTHQMLDRQLLREIRSSLFQDKMNRMRKEINHKKIVQMR